MVPLFLKRVKSGKLPITDERMTRFSITLLEGVNFVISCLKKMWGGEIFVPKIPSYRIIDVAKAVGPKCKYDIIGIRPGEKLHEEMITETDALNCVEFEDYFVILPSIEMWDINKFIHESNQLSGNLCEHGFSYNSSTNPEFLSVKQLKEIISQEL